VVLIPEAILLAAFLSVVLGRLSRRTPVPARSALPDLARYRARSRFALAAISLCVMIAVIVAVLAQARHSNVGKTPDPTWARTSSPSTKPTAVKVNGPPGQPTASQLRSIAFPQPS